MKITRAQLKQIILEELQDALSENETWPDKEGSGELDEEKENNPWAICTASVGRSDKKKYERCVKSVKKKNGDK